MADNWMLGETAALDDYIPTPPSNVLGNAAQGVKDWWTNQPSWLDRAQAENQRTAEAYQRGGMGAIAQQLATDTTEAQDLASGFGGNIKGVKPPVVPGALAAISEYRPPFYSAVEQAVQGAKQNAAPGQQWAGFLRNQPGVKPEEVEALKLGKLFEQPGSVPKEAVLGEIAANRVNVGEVMKGDLLAHDIGAQRVEPIGQHGLQYLRTSQDIADAARHNPQFRESIKGMSEAEIFAAAERLREAQKFTPTKFSQYTLPGGENYREMLLTLPDKGVPSDWRVVTHPEGPGAGFAIKNSKGDYGSTANGIGTAAWNTEEEARRAISDYAKTQSTKPEFQSSHYDEPNILAHVRYNDRVIDGKKTLFVEEVQSDWHQKGKREGYAEPVKTIEPKIYTKDDFEVLKNSNGVYEAKLKSDPEGITNGLPWAHHPDWGTGEISFDDFIKDITKELNEKSLARATQINAGIVNPNAGKVPDAPFKSTWPELAMKRIIREAAEKGYDKVAWTPGSVQAARYPEQLRQHVDNISWSSSGLGGAPRPDGSRSIQAMPRNSNTPLSFIVSKDGVITDAVDSRARGQHVEDLFGKDMARQIMENPSGDIASKDFVIGAKGMQGFYDEILPATVNKLVKKHGGRVQQDALPTNKEGWHITPPEQTTHGRWMVKSKDYTSRGLQFDTEAEAQAALASKMTQNQVHTLDITPSLRAAAMKGFPLFSAGGVAATGVIGGLARQDEYR